VLCACNGSRPATSVPVETPQLDRHQGALSSSPSVPPPVALCAELESTDVEGAEGPPPVVYRSDPRLRLADAHTQTNGPLDREIVVRFIHQNFGRFRLCYQEAYAKDPRLSGEVTTHFNIDAAGDVTKVAITGSTIGDIPMKHCIARGFASLSFPSAASGPTDVTYGITFAPPDGVPTQEVAVDARSGLEKPPDSRRPAAPEHQILWAHRLGGPGTQRVLQVTVDAHGRIVLLGTFEESADIGPLHLAARAGAAPTLFLAWFDAGGTPLAAQTYGTLPYSSSGPSVASTGDGDTFVGGIVDGDFDFGAVPMHADKRSGFIVRLDPLGRARWTRLLPHNDVLAVAADASGSVIVVGSTVNPASPQWASPFITRLGPDGATLFSRVATGVRDSIAVNVAVDASGAALVIGWLPDPGATVDFGLGPLKSEPASQSSFAVSFSPDGRTLWSRAIGARSVAAYALAVAAPGRLAVAGRFSCPEASDGFLIQLDSTTGVTSWMMRVVSGLDDPIFGSAEAVAFDHAGNALLAGPNFVASVDASGSRRWKRAWPLHDDAPLKSPNFGRGLAMDRTGRVAILAGTAPKGTVDFGTGPLAGADRDIFLVALASSPGG